MNITPVHECQCRGDEKLNANGAFWCEYHQVWKTQNWRGFCRDWPAYREAWNAGVGPAQRPPVSNPQPRPDGGPGTELEKLLEKFFITDDGGCACKAHAFQMDLWGSVECRQRLDEIVDWMKKAAEKRCLLFVPRIARWMVRRAIRNAEKQGY